MVRVHIPITSPIQIPEKLPRSAPINPPYLAFSTKLDTGLELYCSISNILVEIEHYNSKHIQMNV